MDNKYKTKELVNLIDDLDNKIYDLASKGYIIPGLEDVLDLIRVILFEIVESLGDEEK